MSLVEIEAIPSTAGGRFICGAGAALINQPLLAHPR
jgi:hypothetical protein